MRIRPWAVVALTAVQLGIMGSPPASASVSIAWTFNDPSSGAGTTQAHYIQTELEQNINAAAAGTWIRIATYMLDAPSTVNALIAADARGVIVQVIADRSAAPNAPATSSGTVFPFEKLFNTINGTKAFTSGGSPINYLTNTTDYTVHPYDGGANDATAKSSWVVMCRNGCVSDLTISHQKFALFNGTTTVFQSSANMLDTTAIPTDGGSGNAAWNNAFTVYGDATIFNAFNNQFLLMRKGFQFYTATSVTTPPAIPPSNTTGVSSGMVAGVWFFPTKQARSPWQYDLDLISSTDCANGGIVKVAQSDFADTGVADRLKQLANQGCAVSVGYTYQGSDTTTVLTHLGGCGLNGHPGVALYQFTKGDPTGFMHSKYVTFTNAAATTGWVATGSLNMAATSGNLDWQKADNTHVRISDAGVAYLYGLNFNKAITGHTRTQAPAC